MSLPVSAALPSPAPVLFRAESSHPLLAGARLSSLVARISQELLVLKSRIEKLEQCFVEALSDDEDPEVLAPSSVHFAGLQRPSAVSTASPQPMQGLQGTQPSQLSTSSSRSSFGAPSRTGTYAG